MKKPVIDHGLCSECEACIELYPEVFRRNDVGFIEVILLAEYTEEEIEECMKNCPAGCIELEER